MPDRLDPPDPAATRLPRADQDDLIDAECATSSESLSQVLWRVFSMRFLRGALAAIIVLALVLYFGVAATALALRLVVMPRIDSFRPRIEAAASAALGAQVSIAALSSHWQGLSPSIEILGLTVRNRNGVVALSVPHASAVVAWRSLLHFEPLLVSLLVEHPEVLAIRHADGSFEVAGVPVKAGGGNKNQLAHWLFTQDTIVLRGGTLQWHDDTRHAPDLTLRNIKLAVFNFGHSHRVGMQADGDGVVLHGPLDFRANFRNGVLADPGIPEGWLGRAYLSVAALDLPQLGNYLDLPVEASQGQIGAQLTFAFAQMNLSSVDGELTGDALALRANPKLPMIVAPAVAMHVNLKHIDNVFELGLRDLSLTLADDAVPLTDGTPVDRLLTIHRLDAVYQRPILGHGQSFSLKGDLVDVGLLAGFSRKLPLPRTLSEQLANFDPRGVIRDYTVAWERAVPDAAAPLSESNANGGAPIIHYQFKAALDGLSIAAQAPPPGLTAQGHKPIGLPGFEHLSGRIDTTEKHGSLTLASQHAAVTVLGLFDQPQLDFDSIGGHLDWDLGHNGAHPTVALRTTDLTLANPDLALTTRIDYRNDGTNHGTLDLAAQVQRMNLTTVARYLPDSLNANLREYLSHALRGGTTSGATIAIKGQLDNFPFDHPEKPGIFHISAPFQDGSFDPSPMPPVLMSDGRPQQWPMLEHIDGAFDLNREQLSFTLAHADYRKVMLTDLHGHVADLSTPDDDMIIEGGGGGPLSDLLAYLGASPVASWTGHVLDPLDAHGDASLALKLEIPRKKGGRIRLNGTVGLHNDTLNYAAVPALSQVNGTLQFTEHSLALQHVNGQFLGGALSAQGSINPDGTMAATVTGRLDAAALRNQATHGAFATLADRLSGSASYSVNLHASHPGVPEITGSADLGALAIDLPAPLGKTAGTEMPLRFQLQPLDSEHDAGAAAANNRSANPNRHGQADFIALPAPPALIQVDAELGPVSLAYLVHAGERSEPSEQHSPAPFAPVVVKGAIGINRPATMPPRGVVANLTLAKLDADAWRTTLTQLATPTPGTSVQAMENRDTWLSAFLPTQLKAHLGSLDLFARTWNNVGIDGSHLNDVWQAEIASDQLTGHLAWHPQSPLSAAGELDAHLGRLIVPSVHGGDPLLQALQTEPRSFPALDLAIDDLTASNRALGKFELQARNLQHDGVPVWQIDQLKLSNPAAKLNATGSWRAAAAGAAKDPDGKPAAPRAPTPLEAAAAAPALPNDLRRTELDFKLEISDGGALLNRLGLPRTLQQGNGTLAGHIGWRGGPDAIDAPTLAGNLSLDLHHGQILKVDPGIGKLLGVLSLQSLVRFITLDFRGVVGTGLAFDSVTGSGKIAQGVAHTDDFKLNSSAAHVAMQGSADLVRETQNLRVTVVPTLSASSAALAATVINPLLGLSSFVAQLVLSDPLAKALTVEYSVTGPWAAPEIRRLKGHTPFVDPTPSPVQPGAAVVAP